MSRNRRFTTYLLRELTTPTLLGLALYTFLLMMNHFFVVAEKALAKNLGMGLTFRLFILGIPELLVVSLPLAVLLGTLIALGRFSADHEWVALQAAGHGPGVLLRPVLTLGLLGSLAGFLIYSVVVPQAHFAQRHLAGEILFASNLAADVKPRVFYDLQDNAVLFVDDIRPGDEQRLQGVLLIQTEPKDGSTLLLLSRAADLYPAADGSGALYVDLYDGVGQLYDSRSPEIQRSVRSFDKITRKLDPAAYLQALLDPPDRQVRDYTFNEVVDELRQARAGYTQSLERAAAAGTLASSKLAERRYASARVEFHQRLALPMASLCFALLALPLGISRIRSGKGAGFAMSLLVILVYRTIFLLARNQALAGKFPPSLGPWVANLVMIAWALFALRSLRRPPGGPSFAARTIDLLRGVWRRRPWRRRSVGGRNGFDDAESSDLAALGGTPNRFVGRLDKYIAMAYLRVLAFALGSAYLIYGLAELQGLVDRILRTQQPMSLLAGYFKYFVIIKLDLVLPIACLVGAVVAFTLLARTGELVAVKASGVGMRRATVPVLLVTLGLCGLLYVVEDRIAPPAHAKAQHIRDRIMNRAPRTYGLPAGGRWSFGPEGERLYHYRHYDATREEFGSLSVFTLDRKRRQIVDLRYSETARWTGSTWKLSNGWHFFKPGAPEETYQEYESATVELDPPSNFAGNALGIPSQRGDLPEQMSRRDLARQIASLRDSGYDITNLRVAYHAKVSQALTPFVMVLLGLPFAFKVGRRGSLYGIGVALLLVLVYWATFAIFNALGLETILRPIVAAWAPNVLFGLLGVYLMLYIRT